MAPYQCTCTSHICVHILCVCIDMCNEHYEIRVAFLPNPQTSLISRAAVDLREPRVALRRRRLILPPCMFWCFAWCRDPAESV
jgi:hypothetical protein